MQQTFDFLGLCYRMFSRISLNNREFSWGNVKFVFNVVSEYVPAGQGSQLTMVSSAKVALVPGGQAVGGLQLVGGPVGGTEMKWGLHLHCLRSSEATMLAAHGVHFVGAVPDFCEYESAAQRLHGNGDVPDGTGRNVPEGQ